MVGSRDIFLVVGGGRESLPFICRLAERGLNPLVLDGDPRCDAQQVGFQTELVPIENPEASSSFAVQLSQSGNTVIGVGSFGVDFPMTVSEIATRLALPGIPRRAAKVSSNKILQKDVLRSLGLRTPGSIVADSIDIIRPQLATTEYPVVLKPVDSRGSRGVRLCHSSEEVIRHFALAMDESPLGRVLVEEFQQGPQYSSETVILNGQATTVGISSRNYRLNSVVSPEFLEDGGELLPDIEEWFVHTLNVQALKLAQELGIESGTIKGDLVLVKEGISWIEFALRPGGGYFGSHEIPLSTGINFIDVVIDLALGLEPNELNLRKSLSRVVCQRFFFAKWDKAVRIVIPASLKESTSILHIELFDDSPRRKLGGGFSKLGMVLSTGTSRAEAISNAESAVDLIVQASVGLSRI